MAGHGKEQVRGWRRRDLVKAGGISVVVASVAAGCGFFSTGPSGEGTSQGGGGGAGAGGKGKGGGSSKGAESPALAARVKSGELPAVKERLPDTPLVVHPIGRPAGEYGGIWNAAMLGPDDTSWLDRSVGYEYLVRWKPDTVAFTLDDITANVAESYEVNTEGTEYTFTLRAGMKWSDGKPFTADDIVFAVQDVYLNEKLYPAPPVGLLSGGKPAKIEKVGANAVKFVFTEPSSLFLHMVASKNSGLTDLAAMPKHYLKQFHADYASDADAVAKKENFSDWVEMFSSKTDGWSNPDLPRLYAWVPKNALGKGTAYVSDRNPYYWKVDPAGSQLPYLDTFRNYLITDPETVLLKASHGEIDAYDRMINTLQNKPVLARNRSQGQYKFFDMRSANMNTALIAFNLTHKDPTLRAILQNRDFRIGLSYAINRPEVIKTVFKSLGKPWQVAPLEGASYFDEKFATQYTEFDLKKANASLDRAGFRRQPGNGPRMGPDGKPIRLKFEISTQDYGYDWSSVAELLKQYWQRVGVDIDIHPEDPSLLYAHQNANVLEMAMWQGDVGALDAHLDPRYLLPYSTGTNFWSYLWAQWYESGGKEGEKPPPAPLKQQQLYDKVMVTVDEQARVDLMKQIVAIAREQFFMVGISRPTGRYGIVRDDFHGVPNGYLESSNYPNPGPTNPEQYSISG